MSIITSTTMITKDDGLRELPFNEERLTKFIKEIAKDFPSLEYQMDSYIDKVIASISSREEYTADQITNLLILNGLENVDEGSPDWTYFCAHIYLKKLYRSAAKNRVTDPSVKYGSFYGLLKTLGSKGIYNQALLRDYSEKEIHKIGKFVDAEKDKLFTYIGLRTLADRYLATDHSKNVFELPQERFLIIAMTLMINEPKERRLALVKEAYWALSNLYMTVATPTLANAGKSYGQLSSCFIDTVDDSLDSIMMNNHDVARLSKNGGGIGIYLGKIRARGSDIKGFKNISGGVIPWMKQLNTIAVNVDQLGQRQGAISVYLDVFHKDIFSFLDARLNNGDERLRTHDIFTGVCLPDLFMEQVQKRGDWYLFDPHEVRRVMGYSLEDFYDEERGRGSFRKKYWECVDNPKLTKERVAAIDIFKGIMKSQLETGTPYMFYRDTVNRANSNSHKGMIYCSNLCTEILQNQSATTIKEEYTSDGKIIMVKEPGDLVVCNLSSIALAKAVKEDVLERLIDIQVRMLDNVIDLNTIPVLQAKLTNEKYRAIGLGTFGMHHLFALEGIYWESDEAVEYVNNLYEKIAYYTISASMKISKEKGWYSVFQNSDWHTGAYFEKRGYVTKENGLDWDTLKEEVAKNGVRNAYLMAVAPNSSTSILAGSTASIDPIFRVFYSEEKKDYKIPVTAPDLDHNTYEFYRKTAYALDQHWSIKQNAARQKHIDQAISFNLYVTNDIKAKALLDLHIDAWESGLKTTYYVRSTSQAEIEECESCHS